MLPEPELLGHFFHQIFQSAQNKRKTDWKKTTKGKPKEKRKKGDVASEVVVPAPPDVQLPGNPSSLAVFASVRLSVLERWRRQTSQILLSNLLGDDGGADSDDDLTDKDPESALRVPKLVGFGLCTVFELLRESRQLHPTLCTKALRALLDILQGQHPEGLKYEPSTVVDPLFDLLLDLATSHGPDASQEENTHLSAVACSCLLALVVARGDTGKLLSATSALLMSPKSLVVQSIDMPEILAALQRSVHNVLLGKQPRPDWISHGIPRTMLIDSLKLKLMLGCEYEAYTTGNHSLTSDGYFLYLFRHGSLYKLGSGYGGTTKGAVIMKKEDFSHYQQGWLGHANGKLYFKPIGVRLSSQKLYLIDSETLVLSKPLDLADYTAWGPGALFSDGESLFAISSSNDDGFAIRSLTGNAPMEMLALKLARKCMEAWGNVGGEDGGLLNTESSVLVKTNTEEDPVFIAAGKDFGLARTTSGKVLFSGKGSSLGLKQSGGVISSPSKWSKWSELPVTKSPKLNHLAVGHEGLHAVLVAEDGSVFFVGTARRGEDGDQAKARRQPKPVKPKKMVKVEGQFIVHAACNNGTTALVNRDGELLMFGKDTAHCDPSTGLVSGLKEQEVQKVALGKAHAVALTSKGYVYTFGINNKGQCGREFAVQVRETPAVVAMETAAEECEEDGEAEWDEEQAEGMCARGRHKWHHDKCMICTICRECTGYSISCLSSMRPDRNPGQACGCGAGDSGCAICGCCRICARESVDNSDVAILGPNGAGDLGGMVRLDVIFGGPGRHSARFQDHLQRRLDERKQRLQRGGKVYVGRKVSARNAAKLAASSSKGRQAKGEGQALAAGLVASLMAGEEAVGSDIERDASRVTSLAPARVIIPSDSPAVQIACGLHHTVVLLLSGEVYTFGSNACGQLGVGDMAPRGGPVLVQVPGIVTQVAAGSNHTVLITSDGEVFTVGSFQKGQLGRSAPDLEDGEGACSSSHRNGQSSRSNGVNDGIWYAVPAPIPRIGPQHGRRATWVGASGDITFVKVDESLINASSLTNSTVVANKTCIVILPTDCGTSSSFKSLVINKLDGNCSSFSSSQQMDFSKHAICLDPLYNVMWGLNCQTGELFCLNPIAANISPLPPLLTPELALPVISNCFVTRTQAALHLLGCIDTLTGTQDLTSHAISECINVTPGKCTTLVRSLTSAAAPPRSKVYSSEDFSAVNRFESYGGGWGYSGHSIEAIRFMSDTDLLVGGFGLFGGRGEYTGKIKLYDIGMDGGEQEIDGELLAETEELPYECAPRQKFAMLFDEPVAIQQYRWYVAWARIGGPSSDCGSSGQGTVSTEDQVVFCFKSSRRANNGTDVNGGQIPQILYKVVVPESQQPSCKLDLLEPVYQLSKSFSRSVSRECFHALLALLQWAWTTFKVGLLASQANIAELENLVFVCRACLRLLRMYTNEIYPNEPKRTPTESGQLASSVGDVRSLLRQILSDAVPRSKRSGKSLKKGPDDPYLTKMVNEILQEAHLTFVACFHAFYPTASLRWSALCHLLAEMDSSSHLDKLLSAVLAALCHPAVRLRSTFPVLGVLEHTTLPLPRETATGQSYSSDSSPETSSPVSTGSSSTTTANNTQAIAGPSQPVTPDNPHGVAVRGSPDAHHFPLLVEHMIYRGQMEEGLGTNSWQFKDVLEKLLDIVTVPISQALNRDKESYSSELTHHCCHLIARVIAELASQSSGSDEELEGACGRVMHTTPCRFMRCNNCRSWNTGNGSPDAVCFTVDRPGVAIIGVGVYGGGGIYEFELELLDDQNSGTSDPSHSQRWNSLEIARGTYGPDDCVSDVAEIKFDKPVVIREGVKYAVRLRNHGGRTNNGDGGLKSVRGPDGTTFTFSTCSLSFNGTTQTRGQIPHILYYSSPQDSENQQNSRAVAEMQARKCTLGLAGAVIKRSSALLAAARSIDSANLEILAGANIFTTLMPLVLANISPVATSDPRSAVQVLEMIQEILPHVSALNLSGSTAMARSNASLDSSGHQDLSNASAVNTTSTTSLHHAIVESEHPYKAAVVSNWKVVFPESVKWLTVEFDPQCGTAQPEDSLQLFIKPTGDCGTGEALGDDEDGVQNYWPVLTKFSGANNWPQMAIVLPGNEIFFSLETASDYVQDEKANNYGFRCLVVGYEWPHAPADGLRHLECELAFLGGMCAASLMKKDLQLPPASVEEVDEDVEAVEEVAQQVFQQNSTLLGKGFALASPPTIGQALQGVLPFSYQSIERQFLRDLVQCTPGTSGGRLARWLQPESFVEPRRCEVLYSKDDMRCGWPAIVTILSKDQYGHLVNAPNLKIEVKASPIDKGDIGLETTTNGSAAVNRRSRRFSMPDALSFGGHPQPSLEVPYEVTVKEKMHYHSISIMKAYENYSFEELRFMSPTLRRTSENMLVRPNGDGTYSATWTPASTGWYMVLVTVDGYPLEEAYRVEVKDAPQGIAPPTTTVIKKTPNQPSRLRKYVAKFSAGLRIRSHPSLQSEHIGTVGVNGIISFVDEIHNDDGVWVRLGNDSMRQYGISSSYPEAWCLQYNQHLGKTLLVPVEEPKAVSDEGFRKVSVKKTSSNESPLKERKLSAPAPTGGPGFYKVVKCGASGHNIRSRPSMTAPPVGMLVAGNRAMIVADDVNSEGTWVQLDHESKKEFCFNTDGEAWSLAVSKGDVVYLQHELANDCRHDKTPGDHHPFSVPPKKAFDFTAQNRADAFTFAQKEPGSASSAGSMTGNPFVFGSLDSKKPEIAPKPQSVGAGRFSALNKWLRGESTPTIVDTRGSPPVIPPPPGPAVKLVTGMSSKDLPPELMGVSVKDLVKAIGESRANGNGVTPPGTPRRPSRSSSPKAPLPGTATILAHQASSRSSSPVPIPPAGKLDSVASSGGSPKSIGVSPLVSAPGNMTTAESGRRGSTQSDTSALLSSLTRDLSHSPSNSSLQMRSESPNSLHGQLIDQAAGSPKLTQTGTQTSPDGSLKSSLHFNVGDSLGAATAVPVRISPKPVRKERSNSKNVPNASSRSRRANSPKEHHHKSRNRGTSPAHPLAKEPVKEAIAPSVAECLRAVFAAFLWHEGLVHDAMACASFLKFHPGLPKQGALVITRQQNSLSSNLDKVKQRHSVEVSASNYLHIQPSTLETLTRCAANANANRRKKHDSAGAIREEEPTSDAGSTAGAAVTVLPPALRSLVLLWEELSKGCLRTIQRQEVMQSPMTASVVLRRTESGKAAQSSSNQPTSSKEKKEGEKRGRKKKDWRPIGAVVKSQEISGRLPGLPQRETVCELCGGSFPQPITFHMKSCHPGCGESAGGKGYNSGGNFCVGWAGNCGDGGIVGSTWYLICDTCRERYLKQRKQQRKDSLSGHKKSKKKVTSKLLSPMLLQESHVVMKNNAMFLLELASASSRDPPPCSPPLRRSPHGMPSVSEQEDGPFPSLPSGLPGFQCLSTLGVSPAQVRHLAEEHLLAETLRKNGEEGLDRYLEGMESKSVRPVSDCPLSDSEDSLRGRPFHRSISMGTKDWQSGRLVRKRNNSSGEPNEAGSSLLCHPSAALQKLVPFDLSCTLSTTDENNAPRPRCDLMERPVMEFVMQQHNLESLQLAMKQAIRKAACRVYAMQALTWLLRSVTQPTCLHDLLWWFVAALTPASEYSGAIAEQPMDNELGRIGKFEDHELHAVCEHPLSDLAVAGDAVRPLPSAFHSLLQAVADLMLLLPMGSALQQMAVRCWGIKFRHSDHSFLHRSHVFSNISKILSRTEEEEAFDESHHSILSTTTSGPCFVETLRDLTANVEIKASSRQAMVFSLTDFSTETFWESSDEDRNKTKFLMVSCAKNSWPKMVYVHIDNCRDLANKVSIISFQSGPNAEELYKLTQVDVETRYSGWISSIIPENHHSVIRIELRGPDNTLRVRQVRILGDIEGQELSARTTKHHSALSIQQKNCEAETLRVFRLITSQVFGKLIQGVEMEEAAGGEEGASEARENTKGEESNDLREHMVGILFSRSKLTNLQRQVCQHIVQAIRSESSRVKEEWEAFLCSAGSQIQSVAPGEKIVSDTYCFEMLSMMLALSGSTVGRAYLSQQTVLLKDLLSLLHTGSARVQRQVTSLLRRMLPEVPPQHLAAVLGVERLPPADFSIVTASNKNGVAENEFDMHKMGILDVFLSVIAKSLTVQVRVKGGGKETQAKGTSTASLATSIKSAPSQGRWWMRGCNSRKLSEGIISLLKDMAAGKLSEAWADVTKGAVAENILNLTKLPESSRSPQQCLASPTLWLALASLCVLDADHVERLSSGQWSAAEGQPTVPRPTCSNHDDGDTAAIIQCNACGNLCAECDRVLHLHRRTRLHQRQVCKEEEEAIKVDLHEGCGRTKLFWLLALADSSTLKALVEFRERGTRSKAAAAGTVAAGVCRFCGATGSSGLLAIGNVCADHECQEHAKNACSRLHACGHMCGGVQAESPCLPCLHGCSDEPNLKQDADDMCMICFTDALACAPAVQLKCGHVFHMHCCKNALVKRWAGPRITFSFAHCPICKSDVEHPVLNTLLAPIRELYEDVRRKALMRLEYEGLNRAGRTHKDPAAYAMDKYAYYVCFKCKKAYYGGEARCDADAGITEDYDPSELVCGACSDVSRAQMCPKHGTDFLEYKCRYCCSVAVFFCFGTTHFCNACHDDFQRVTNLPKHELPHCPAGPRAKQLEGEECPLHIKHPATGEEFALGCGVCRNAHTF